MSQSLAGRFLPPGQQATIFMRRFAWLFLLIGASLLMVWAWANSWPPAVKGIDIEQHRANVALPAATGEFIIKQSFTAGHDGLAEVEVLLVRYGEAAADSGGEVRLQLFDDGGEVVGERQMATAGLVHNQSFVLRFPPQADSAGRVYTLQISGNGQNPIGVWAYDLDVHSGGSLEAGETRARDIRLVTRYRLTAAVALASLAGIVGRQGSLMCFCWQAAGCLVGMRLSGWGWLLPWALLFGRCCGFG
jgi:hypothetical protein